jgi:UDP-2,3-diacylglucosamine pyrophosphatase LpxH
VKLRYRTVWISDIHLGTRGCRAADLARFLKHLRCQKLYLVGDILDMSRLKQRWYWPPEQNEVLRRVLKMTKRGTEVLYVPGNHDDAARGFLGLEFGGVKVVRDAVHQAADGRRLLVIHGDQFDLIVTHQRWLALLGGMAYDWLVVVNRFYNRLRGLGGRPYWSLSQYIKLKVKSACNFISRYEETLIGEARRRGLDGVICGHVHKAESRTGAIYYYNCGDWVESCTALVEHEDGRIEVIDALAVVAQAKALAHRGRAPVAQGPGQPVGIPAGAASRPWHHADGNGHDQDQEDGHLVEVV